MQGFKQLFEEYGADYDSTMERFMGNESLYLKFLDMLFQDNNLQRLQRAVADGDMADAFEAAHTLKGVTGNMGLAPLYQAVCEIVEPLRKKEARSDYQQMYDIIETEFQKAAQLREQLKTVAQS